MRHVRNAVNHSQCFNWKMKSHSRMACSLLDGGRQVEASVKSWHTEGVSVVRSVLLRHSTLECKTDMLSETSGTSHSSAHRHVPEERKSQLHRCASLKSRTFCGSNPLIGTFCKIKGCPHWVRVVRFVLWWIVAIKCHCFHTQPEPAGLCSGDTMCLVRQKPNLYSLWSWISGLKWFALKFNWSRSSILWAEAHVPC